MAKGANVVDLYIMEYFPGFGKCIFQLSMSVKTNISFSAATMAWPAGDSISSSGFSNIPQPHAYSS